MSYTRAYICDICQAGIKNPNDSFGVHLVDGILTLGGYGCCDNNHICYSCARRLALLLNSSEIQKLLNKKET